MLQHAGETPFCLSRGYGGSLAGPQRVDANADGAAQVGDEALLLARVAPTIVARDRVAGAEAARAAGASVVVMDDGLQNASLAKDFTLAVVDGRRGLGNARVFPAGPLRAPLEAQLARTDALLMIGEGRRRCDVAAAPRPAGFSWRLAAGPAAVAATESAPGARLRRHRRSGQIFRDRNRGRHRGRRSAAPFPTITASPPRKPPN